MRKIDSKIIVEELEKEIENETSRLLNQSVISGVHRFYDEQKSEAMAATENASPEKKPPQNDET